MIQIKRIIVFLIVFVALLCLDVTEIKADGISEDEINKIDEYVEQTLEKGNIPGLAISIVKGSETVYSKGYGYSDLKNRKEVSSSTLFELGSCSKSFTGVAIWKLVHEEKIDMDASVTDYIPWFAVEFEGGIEEITIRNLMDHTSGITPDLISIIPPSQDDNALEQTIRNVTEYELYRKPGSRYMYSTVNYDVLGYIIETVSGKTYEDYMYEDVLKPLGLFDVVIGRENLLTNPEASLGYRCSFWGNAEYDAPIYKGNTPAGYLCINADEAADWMKIQLKTAELTDDWERIIEKSQKVDESLETVLIEPYDEPFRYTSGWMFFGSEPHSISHGGNNPTFSSYIKLDTEKAIGISVMGNRNTDYVYEICRGIDAILNHDQPTAASTDFYVQLNLIFRIVMAVSLAVMIYVGVRLILLKKKISKGIAIRSENNKRGRITLIIWLLLVVISGAFLYHIPNLFLWGYSWDFVTTWAPGTMVASMLFFYTAFCFVAIHRVLSALYIKTNNKR